jgi:transposase
LDLQLDCPSLRVIDLSIEPDRVIIHAEPTAACPQCGGSSSRVHSRYSRRLADLPVQGGRLVLKLSARRFVCVRKDCPRRVFCERLPELVDPLPWSAQRGTPSASTEPRMWGVVRFGPAVS